MVTENFKSYLKEFITENEAERKRDEFNVIRDKKHIKATNELLDTRGEKKLLKGLKMEYFHL